MSDYSSIQQRFSEVASRYPNGLAIKSSSRVLTYSELDALSDAVAVELRRVGVTLHGAVLLNVRRSVRFYIVILGVLKAGAAYIPIDESLPAVMRQQLETDVFAAHEAVVRVVDITGQSDTAIRIESLKCGSSRTVARTAFPDGRVAAYVMFTSGSTGSPKGVIVPHCGVLRLVIDSNYLRIVTGDNVLQLAPTNFDASTFEIWGALLNGACLVPYECGAFDLHELEESVHANRITIMWLTAPLFHLVTKRAPHIYAPLRALLCGGDVVQSKAVREVLQRFPGMLVINGYGPTENTTFTSCHVMSSEDDVDGSVPIGFSINGTTTFVLDERLMPVARGSAGELYVGGKGLALGYLNAAARTACSFIASPFEVGERMYRTGDLVWAREDGALGFVGRVDNMVKIRGYRVSLDELTKAISELEFVDHAFAVAEHDLIGNRMLVALVQAPGDAEVVEAKIRSSLLERMPRYMIPDVIRVRKDLALNSNGKVIRDACF